MNSTAMSSQGYLSHSETEAWAVTAHLLPASSPEIRLGPLRINASISERTQNDKFLTLTVSKSLIDPLSAKPATTRKGGKEAEGGEPQKASQDGPRKESTTAAGGPDIDLKISAYSGDRKVSIGHATIKDILRADKKTLDLTNFLSRTDLQRHQNNVVLDFSVQGLPVSRPSVAALWQDVSTADVVIQCAEGEGATAVLVHKAYVLEEIPSLASFLGLDIGSPPSHKHDSIDRSLDHGSSPSDTDLGHTATKDDDLASESTSDTSGADEACQMTSDSGPQPQQQTKGLSPKPGYAKRKGKPQNKPNDTSAVHSMSPPQQRQSDLKELEASCFLTESQFIVPTPSSDTCSPSSASSLFSNLDKALASTLTLFRRPDIEVWNWPSHYPATSCGQVMAWIYKQELPSEADFQLEHFELLMKLCELLQQRDLGRHYISLARSLMLSCPRPVSLFKMLDYNARHAQRFLKPMIVRRIVEKPALLLRDPEVVQHFAAVDPSDITYDVLQSILGCF